MKNPLGGAIGSALFGWAGSKLGGALSNYVYRFTDQVRNAIETGYPYPVWTPLSYTPGKSNKNAYGSSHNLHDPRVSGAHEPIRNLLAPDTPRSNSMSPSPYKATFAPAGTPVAPNGSLPPNRPMPFAPSLPPYRPVNLLASASAPFEEPYQKGYGRTGQVQAGQAAPAPQAGKSSPSKPSYSLKDTLEFLGKVYPAARDISDKTGLSLPFILGHTAAEVDWGKNVEGNNLFNLKADENWRGLTYTKNDTRYRAYPTYGESMKDYLAYLESNPRYGKVFEPTIRESVDKLADAIGYSVEG